MWFERDILFHTGGPFEGHNNFIYAAHLWHWDAAKFRLQMINQRTNFEKFVAIGIISIRYLSVVIEM